MTLIDNQEWVPGIGDPTVTGWITVFAYIAACILCFFSGRLSRQLDEKATRVVGDQRFWMTLAWILAFLAVNKQLDLQTAFTGFGRWLAVAQGWYAERRLVQRWFVGFVAAAGVVSLGVFLLVVRGAWHRHLLATAGLTFLLVFVVIRAASFHHVDTFLGSSMLGVRFNTLLELGGITCIALSAGKFLGEQRRKATG